MPATDAEIGGTVNHVLSAMNPQGCRVYGFKQPSAEELAHAFLWRIHKATPAKGEVAIFNRSQYEDVLVVRVHDLVPKSVWSKRYDLINDFERLLVDNGTRVVKFYLHISEDEQLRRGPHGLNVHLHRSAARHADAEHLVVQVQLDDARAPVGESQQRLVAHPRLGTAASHPTEERAPLGVDDRLGSGPRGGRAAHAHDGGDRAGLAGADARVEYADELRVRGRRHVVSSRRSSGAILGAARARVKSALALALVGVPV